MTKIVENRTKEQYDHKYRRHKNNLFSFSKEDVINFSKQFKTKDENALLKGHTWWLINDRYYIAPKASSRLMITSSFALIAALGGGGFGIYKNFFSVKKTTADVSESVKQDAEIIVEKGKEPVIGQEFTAQIEVKKDETKEDKYLPVKLEKVTTGGIEVPPKDVTYTKNSKDAINDINEQDNYYTYTLENDNKDAKLFIKKVLGPIEIEFKTVEQTEIVLESYPNKFDFSVGESFTLDGMKIVVKTSDGNSFVAKNYASSISEGYTFTDNDIGFNKKVNVTYKTFSETYQINVYGGDIYEVNTNEELIAALREPGNKKTIFLNPLTSGGSYCIANNFDVGGNYQNLTLVGSGGVSNKTKYKVGWDNYPSGAESCGEYNYAGSNVHFKNIEFDNESSLNYGRSGFIGAASLEFNDCSFKRNFDFWGIGTVTFNNCEFKTLYGERKKGDKYLLTTYSGKSFIFNNCNFQGYDRALNLFRDAQELYTVEVNNCTFTSDSANKVVFNIKDHPGVDGYYCILKLNNIQWNGFGDCIASETETAYQSDNTLFNCCGKGDNNSQTKIYVNEKCVWEYGQRTAEPLPPEPNSNK